MIEATALATTTGSQSGRLRKLHDQAEEIDRQQEIDAERMRVGDQVAERRAEPALPTTQQT